jgi:hypothetical protein
VDEICFVIGDCSGCPLHEVVVADPLSSMEKNSAFFWCLAGGQTVCLGHIIHHFSLWLVICIA